MVVSLQSSSDEVKLREEVVNKTKHDFKTKIGNKFSAKDVIKVWDCISKWIESNMNREKGILIKGIGYFTFAKWTINVGKKYPYIVRKPVFVVDEKLAKDFNLKRRRPYNTGNIHERYLNLLSVAQHFQLNIDMVTNCFKEVVTAFRKLLYENKNCELPFSQIGKLQIKNKIITMKFYQEFLERQNQNLKEQMEENKKHYSDWNADQSEYQKRPSSAMSIIDRPASSLSQYRPGTGYDRVLPDINDTTGRPESRPVSRLSVQSRPDSRPSSRLSVQSRPDSRLSVQSRPDSRLSALSRPDSRLSVQSRPDSRLCVPQSRPVSSQSARCRPSSGHVRARSGSFTLSRAEHARPVSRSFVGPDATITRPESRSLSQSGCERSRPTSRTSYCRQNRPSSARSISSSTSRLPSSITKPPPSTSKPTPGSKTTCDDDFPAIAIGGGGSSDGALNPKRPTSKTTDGKNDGVCDQMMSTAEHHYDESLCYLCNIRKLRFDQIEVRKPNFSPTDKKENFMKGDDLFNKLTNNEDIENKRKNRTKEISNYNYVTANELFKTVNKEKTKTRNERFVENCILVKRPASIHNQSEKEINLKQSFLNQIKRNEVKTDTAKTASLKDEKLMQEELLKNLHDERMKNIKAKARSKENYLTILNEHLKNKIKTEEKMKKKNDKVMIPNTILGTDEVQSSSCAKLNKYKNRELANYQLKQHTARNLAIQEQKEKSIDFEKNLLNQLKEEDEILQRKMLQKKLNQKKFLTEDLNKWSTMPETERRKNEIPKAYPMTFPLKKVGNRCRLCKKNGLRYPTEKITNLPY